MDTIGKNLFTFVRELQKVGWDEEGFSVFFRRDGFQFRFYGGKLFSDVSHIDVTVDAMTLSSSFEEFIRSHARKINGRVGQSFIEAAAKLKKVESDAEAESHDDV